MPLKPIPSHAPYARKKTKDPTIDNNDDNVMRLEGRVASGYESVRDMFAQLLRDGEERHLQLCVYVGQECVVDLWGSSSKSVDEQFGPDSLINVFSSTKCLEAIVVAKCVDRGRIRYIDVVAQRKWWMEYLGRKVMPLQQFL